MRRKWLQLLNIESRSFPFSCDEGWSHSPNIGWHKFYTLRRTGVIMLRLKVVFLLCVSALLLNATNSTKENSPNLKFRFEVIKHYPNSNYYLGKLTFENKGNTPISFWEKINNYEGLLGFNTGGWWFVHNYSYDWYLKFKTELPPQVDYESTVVVLPHKKVIKYVLFIIGNHCCPLNAELSFYYPINKGFEALYLCFFKSKPLQIE